MSKFIRRQLWWLVAAALLIARASGQGGATGAIGGTVQDATGAVIANADVRITNQDTGTVTRTTKTDATGSFTANLLPVATYTVSITSAGFREAKIPDVVVRVTETTRMSAKLVPLQVLEKVEVQAVVQAVETTSATTGQAIESKTIRDLPLATQNFQQLLTLSTGAQSELNASTQLGRGATKIFVNGQREDNNNYQIEGISATDYNVAQGTNVPLPNPDVLGEFKVQTSLYDASQGRNGGGNVNAILKTGTKTFHGDDQAHPGRPGAGSARGDAGAAQRGHGGDERRDIVRVDECASAEEDGEDQPPAAPQHGGGAQRVAPVLAAPGDEHAQRAGGSRRQQPAAVGRERAGQQAVPARLDAYGLGGEQLPVLSGRDHER